MNNQNESQVSDGWSIEKKRGMILIQLHNNGEFVKGKWIEPESDRLVFEFLDSLIEGKYHREG